jgi:hypothetical protein
LPLVCSLVDAMNPGDGGDGPDRLLRRCIIALATMAARIEEIAAVVEIPAATLEREYADELGLGGVHRRCALLLNLDAAANGRGRRSAHVGAVIALLNVIDRAEERERRAAGEANGARGHRR